VRGISQATVTWASGTAIAAAIAAAGVTGIVVAIHSHPAQAQAAGAVSAAGTAHRDKAPDVLRVLSVTPSNGSHDVDGAGQIRVTFSSSPDTTTLPKIFPSIAGTWQRQGNSVVFTPQAGFTPSTQVTVTVPQTVARHRSAYIATYTTAAYSNLRLQQLLAQLGYLPMSWSADLGGTITPDSEAGQVAAAYSPPAGSFTMQGGYPSALYSFWQEGEPNLLEKGAITGFEGDHNMPADGVASPAVWNAVLKDAENGERNTRGYSYAVASQSLPESLTIWHNGHVVLDSAANTGASDAPTPVGTFPVYEKLPFQIMRGTNPSGSHYADPVQWVSYFNGGAAVHYFNRGSYGYPQSLGCVELPYTAAHEAYPYLPYGTLVTVTP
jgi:lipoprotein-anchoring transpeptidase ErfK/SrfK